MKREYIAIDRETASRINPLINNDLTEETLDNVALVIYELGAIVTDEGLSNRELSTGNLWHFFSVIAAALNWESENIHSRRDAQAEAKAGLQKVK